MVYTHKKIFHFLLSAALIHSSLHPLYASMPEHEYVFAKEVRARSQFLNHDDTLQQKVDVSVKNQSLAAQFVRDLISHAYNKVTFLLSIKSTHDTDSLNEYFKENFIDEIENFKIYKPNQHNLIQLQDRVWNGEVTAYQYVKGLQELESFVSKKLLKRTLSQFQRKLASSPQFIDWNLQRDLVTVLKSHNEEQQTTQDFDSLFSYYGRIYNPVDYTETLVDFLRFIQKNKDTINLTNEAYGTLEKSIVNAINSRDQEQYRALKNEHRFSQTALQELPFYGEDVSEDSFNSSRSSVLKTKEEGEEISSFMTILNDIANSVYTGGKYIIENPMQALTMGLSFQIAAAAACPSLKTQVKAMADNVGDMCIDQVKITCNEVIARAEVWQHMKGHAEIMRDSAWNDVMLKAMDIYQKYVMALPQNCPIDDQVEAMAAKVGDMCIDQVKITCNEVIARAPIWQHMKGHAEIMKRSANEAITKKTTKLYNDWWIAWKKGNDL